MDGDQAELKPRAMAKRAQIRSGAQRIFLANGFAATSTDAIAAEAGVSKQTLYAYYRTKEELFVDVLRAVVGELPGLDSALAAAGQTVDERQALRDCLIRLARELVGRWMQPDYLAFMRLVFAEVPRLPELGELWAQTIPAQVFRTTARLLETARARGVVQYADVDVAARLFIGPLITYVVVDGLGTAEPPVPPSDDTLRQVVDLCLAAIAIPMP